MEMSKYLVLIYEDEAAYATGDAALFQRVMDAHNKFGAENKDAIVGGEALQPTSTATSIRGGVVTDGAFAETKEALGGYFLFEGGDLDAALELAARVPAARLGGAVEVRPLVESW
jgi:hypothetical protein